MKSEGKTCFYIQCQKCGDIKQIKGNCDLEDLFIETVCPCCGYTKALILGNDSLDIYKYMNINVDYHFFEY